MPRRLDGDVEKITVRVWADDMRTFRHVFGDNKVNAAIRDLLHMAAERLRTKGNEALRARGLSSQTAKIAGGEPD